jgi:hypothetical protein
MRLTRLIVACVATGLLAAAFSPIGIGQAKSTRSPQTVTQCKKQFKHNRKALTACIKRVKHKKPTSGCTLETSWANGEFGDKKDFSVKLKGAEEPGPLQVEVTVHNSRIIICSASISVQEGTKGGGLTPKTFPVTISSHGGLSSKVTLPATGQFFAPGAKVFARLK